MEKEITFTNVLGLDFFPPKPAVKEVPAVQQEEEFPVFNSVNNEQGEKQPWQD